MAVGLGSWCCFRVTIGEDLVPIVDGLLKKVLGKMNEIKEPVACVFG